MNKHNNVSAFGGWIIPLVAVALVVAGCGGGTDDSGATTKLLPFNGGGGMAGPAHPIIEPPPPAYPQAVEFIDATSGTHVFTYISITGTLSQSTASRPIPDTTPVTTYNFSLPYGNGGVIWHTYSFRNGPGTGYYYYQGAISADAIAYNVSTKQYDRLRCTGTVPTNPAEGQIYYGGVKCVYS